MCLFPYIRHTLVRYIEHASSRKIPTTTHFSFRFIACPSKQEGRNYERLNVRNKEVHRKYISRKKEEKVKMGIIMDILLVKNSVV